MPRFAQGEGVGMGEVGLLLAVVVIDVHRRHIQPRVREVVEVVVGQLGIHQQGVAGGEVPTHRALEHEVIVPLPILVVELPWLLTDEGTGVASLGVVEVGLRPPVALCNAPEESHLGT